MPHQKQNFTQLKLDYSFNKPEITAQYNCDSTMSVNKKILNSIKQKPYFSKGDFVLYQNDCLKLLSQLPDNSIDMIFADPPYFFPAVLLLVKTGKWLVLKRVIGI